MKVPLDKFSQDYRSKMQVPEWTHKAAPVLIESFVSTVDFHFLIGPFCLSVSFLLASCPTEAIMSQALTSRLWEKQSGQGFAYLKLFRLWCLQSSNPLGLLTKSIFCWLFVSLFCLPLSFPFRLCICSFLLLSGDNAWRPCSQLRFTCMGQQFKQFVITAIITFSFKSVCPSQIKPNWTQEIDTKLA